MNRPRPVSRHHVLSITPQLASVPSHLVKTLMCLAAHANHTTGQSRPGEQVMADWSIPYSTWHRHCLELTALGFIRQTVRGNRIRKLAAEYQMLFAPNLTPGTPTTTKGKGALQRDNSQNPPGPKGGVPTGEIVPWLPLTESEAGRWAVIAAALLGRLDPADRDALVAQISKFDQELPLKRTAVRLAHLGHERLLVDALTERSRPDQRTYFGVTNVPAVLFTRLRKFAAQHEVYIFDGTPVEPTSETAVGDVATQSDDTQTAWASYGITMRGAGLAPA